MQLLVICNKCPFPVLDGGTSASKGLIDCLLETGAEITLAPFSTAKHPVREEAMFSEWSGRVKLISIEVAAHIRKLPLLMSLFFPSATYQVERIRTAESVKQVNKMLETFYDVIILDGLFPLAFTDEAKKKCNTLIYRAHNVESEIWRKLSQKSAFPKSLLLRVLSDRLEKYEVTQAGKTNDIWGISAPTSNYFNQFAFNNTVVYPSLSIDLQTTKHDYFHANSNKLKLFHIGSMDWEPNREGIDYFLENYFPSLRREFPTLEFHIGGRHMPPHLLRCIIEGVFVYGEIEDYEKFTEDKHLLLVSILSGSGIRMKIPEAWSREIPVLATAKALEGLPGENGVHYLSYSSADELQKIIRKILAGKIQLEKVAQSGKELISTYFSKETISLHMKERLKACNIPSN